MEEGDSGEVSRQGEEYEQASLLSLREWAPLVPGLTPSLQLMKVSRVCLILPFTLK